MNTTSGDERYNELLAKLAAAFGKTIELRLVRR